jgi:hypothetical protein
MFPKYRCFTMLVSTGHNNVVSVSGVVIDADDNLRSLDPVTRGCIFSDETANIKLHKSYSQDNCFLECSLLFAQGQLKLELNVSSGCTPWYFPFVNENYSMCNPWQTVRISEIMKNEVPLGKFYQMFFRTNRFFLSQMTLECVLYVLFRNSW